MCLSGEKEKIKLYLKWSFLCVYYFLFWIQCKFEIWNWRSSHSLKSGVGYVTCRSCNNERLQGLVLININKYLHQFNLIIKIVDHEATKEWYLGFKLSKEWNNLDTRNGLANCKQMWFWGKTFWNWHIFKLKLFFVIERQSSVKYNGEISNLGIGHIFRNPSLLS